MTLLPDVIASLTSLPCFDEIISITLLTGGLSQTAIKVSTAKQVFFAKKLNHDTANTEISCALISSNKGAGQDQTNPLSPAVIYYDKHWMVTRFVEGNTLAKAEISNEEKVSTALALMAKLHQRNYGSLNQTIQPLNTTLSVKRLLTQPRSFLARQSELLSEVTDSLSCNINRLIDESGSPSRLCHGDMNFTNILVESNQKNWLVDYECAHFAPAEFDLAMFIAVNNIPLNQLNDIIADYMNLNQQYHCNKALLNHYLLYSFFINGLWYFDNNIDDENIDKMSGEQHCLFHRLAKEQWSAFDNFALTCSIDLPKLIPLIS